MAGRELENLVASPAAAFRAASEDVRPTLNGARQIVAEFRFVPAAYLAVCGNILDRGAEQLLYMQSLIDEEI